MTPHEGAPPPKPATPPKPAILAPDVSMVPAELRDLPAWVGWRLALRGNKGDWTKEPVNIRTGGRAASDRPATWVDFQTAVAGYNRWGCDGIGLCRTDDFVFIDLDGCLDVNGKVLVSFSWAATILPALKGKGYIEISPSGRGIHAIVRGTLPPGARQFNEPGGDHTGFAFYDKNRYFTFTGRQLKASGPIEDLTAQLSKLHQELFPPKPSSNGSSNDHNGHHANVPTFSSDADLLERAFQAGNGDKFKRLWAGDTTGYDSPSEADLGLCNMLAFWTGKDASRMDALFRRSGLFREDKWGKRTDYRERTIAKAVEQTTEVYEPGHSHAKANYRANGAFGATATAAGEPGEAENSSDPKEAPRGTLIVNWPEPPREEAFYGLAGEWVRLVEPHTEADPAALLVQFLVAFGSVIGRGAHWLVEADQHYTNLFAVIVGQTAKGRKGTSLGQVRRVFGELDTQWFESRVMGGLSTGEGLIWGVRDEIRERVPIKEKGRIVDYEDQITDKGETDKRLLVVEPEFASVLQRAEREANTLSAVIRQSWDTGNLRVLTKKQSARATDAHVSIIGHITKDELKRLLSTTETANGFANRFLWVCSKRSRCLPNGGSLDSVDFTDLIRRLRAAVEFSRRAGRMQRDDAAQEIWNTVYRNVSEEGQDCSALLYPVLKLSCCACPAYSLSWIARQRYELSISWRA